MMFFNLIEFQIKKTLILKKTKITDYGRHKEFSAGVLKTRYYSFFKSEKRKFLKISSVSIKWSPTITHLLSEVPITILLQDSRSSVKSGSGEELLSMKKPSSIPWTLSLETEMYVPSSELFKGLPLSFDIQLPATAVKADCEIGRLTFSVFVSFTHTTSATKIGPAKFDYNLSTEVADGHLYWLGMEIIPRNQLATTEKTSAELVSGYLNGDYNFETLCNKIKQIAMRE
ncbi:TPA_asm: P3 [Cypripedium gammacytorhabdovirus 1]|nr:TPA_asm: P3 [Cypripedium gammacytorhabdovirus 1]